MYCRTNVGRSDYHDDVTHKSCSNEYNKRRNENRCIVCGKDLGLKSPERIEHDHCSRFETFSGYPNQ